MVTLHKTIESEIAGPKKYHWFRLKITWVNYLYKSKHVSVSGCLNLMVSQTAGPLSLKFGSKAQLYYVGIIAIVLYL